MGLGRTQREATEEGGLSPAGLDVQIYLLIFQRFFIFLFIFLRGVMFSFCIMVEVVLPFHLERKILNLFQSPLDS